MSERIDAIAKTRQTAATILAESAREITDISEAAFAGSVRTQVANHIELFPDGWYDPPAGGVAALWGDDRLKFDTLRNPDFFPKEDVLFGPETCGMVYMSPVDRATGMIGDIGLTLYHGNNSQIQNHLKDSYRAIHEVAEQVQTNMTLSEVYMLAVAHFEAAGKKPGWMMTTHDSDNNNLGHIAPGSFGEVAPPDATWEERKEFIRSRRLYVKKSETFKIPETCAFTFEARLTDSEGVMPFVFYHLMVTIDNGTKTVLTNFEPIFEAAGMGYML